MEVAGREMVVRKMTTKNRWVRFGKRTQFQGVLRWIFVAKRAIWAGFGGGSEKRTHCREECAR